MEVGLSRKITQECNIYAFGEALIKTEDLDPAYVGLYKARLPEPQLIRLLIGYWLFYSVGLAAWLSEQENYWDRGREGGDQRRALAPRVTVAARERASTFPWR